MESPERATSTSDVIELALNEKDRSPLERQIAERLDRFTPSQKRLAAYILRYPNDAAFLSGTDLSHEVGVSEAAVSRFIRAVGFNSFAELRKSLALHLHQKLGMASRMDKLLDNLESQDDFFPAFIYGEIEYLQKSLQSVSSTEVNRCGDLVRSARRVFLAGHRASLPVREMLDYRLSRFRIETVHLTDSERYLLDKARFIESEDLLIGITFQRVPADLRMLFDVAARRGAPSILITDLPLVPRSLNVSVILSASRGPQNVTNSFTVPMAIASAIVWSVGRKLGADGHRAVEELDQLRQRYGYEPTDDRS